MKKKFNVYTVLDDFKPHNSDYEVLSYTELGEDTKEWIEETSWKLIHGMSQYKEQVREILSDLFKEVYIQVYFRIGKKGYFVDFFIPHLRTAIETGSISQERDSFFKKIGIRVVHLNYGKVTEESIKTQLQNKPKQKENKPRKLTKREKIIRSAYNKIIGYKNRVGTEKDFKQVRDCFKQ